MSPNGIFVRRSGRLNRVWCLYILGSEFGCPGDGEKLAKGDSGVEMDGEQ